MGPYKDKMNRWRTASLFKELNESPMKHIYTLDEARAIYMKACDVTEYLAAMQLLGSWDHWQMLVKSVKFRPIIEKWREELSVKVRSQAILNVMEMSEQNNGFQAARWLAEKGWESKSKKGRPSKEDIKRAAREEAGIRDDIAEDAKRISLVH